MDRSESRHVIEFAAATLRAPLSDLTDHSNVPAST